MESLYGTDHAIMQKYGAFISIQESIDDNHDALIELRRKNFELIESINRRQDGKESIFLLEAYYD